MRIDSAEAVRRLLHLAFRDAHTTIDLTYAHCGFWEDPLPPGLTVTSNNLDVTSDADLHLDFTATSLLDGAYDLAVFDPPHIADGGAKGILARRFGTVRGVPGLWDLLVGGATEARRIAAVGILVKVADYSHQGELLQLSRWIQDVIPVPPYIVMHTIRPGYLRDGKHRVTRVPRNNGATWLAFRRDGHRHRDFDRLYRCQQALAMEGAA